MPADQVTHAVVVLVDDEDEAATVAGVVQDVADPARVAALVPPLRGAGFLADSGVAAEIDRWWRESVPRTATPVYVLDFSPRIVPWLKGLDGHFILRGAPADLASDMDASVETVPPGSALELAARVLQHLAAAGVCGWEDADGLVAFVEATQPPRDDETAAPTPHPFDLLATMMPEAPASPESPAASPPPAAVPLGVSVPPHTGVPRGNGGRRTLAELLRLPAWRGLRASRSEAVVSDADLATALARRGSMIVAVGSRKGGVGKTSHAAGMAIVAGSVLDAIGHRAVIVDANVANPDAWGVLNLPAGAATVRDTVAALEANLDPPRPAFATTPALACYPEARESTEYSRHDIRLLAEHLRRGFTLAVVDLSNRLPDPTGGPEAAAAAYWLEVADVVVLPTAWSKQDFNGVLDYLELPDLPPAVVAYITPRARRHREHPLTQRYLDAIAQHARSVVQLPDEADNVRYASMAGVPVDSVSRRLRAGYRALTEAVVFAAGVSRQ